MSLRTDEPNDSEFINDLLDYWADGDPFDRFPWSFTRYTEPFQDRDGIVFGGISTPNGERPDGRVHTYWHVAGDIWEPTGLLICAAVNEAAHRRFGTPTTSDVGS